MCYRGWSSLLNLLPSFRWALHRLPPLVLRLPMLSTCRYGISCLSPCTLRYSILHFCIRRWLWGCFCCCTTHKFLLSVSNFCWICNRMIVLGSLWILRLPSVVLRESTNEFWVQSLAMARVTVLGSLRHYYSQFLQLSVRFEINFTLVHLWNLYWRWLSIFWDPLLSQFR